MDLSSAARRTDSRGRALTGATSKHTYVRCVQGPL